MFGGFTTLVHILLYRCAVQALQECTAAQLSEFSADEKCGLLNPDNVDSPFVTPLKGSMTEVDNMNYLRQAYDACVTRQCNTMGSHCSDLELLAEAMLQDLDFSVDKSWRDVAGCREWCF